MKIFGITIGRRPQNAVVPQSTQSVDSSRGGWFGIIRDRWTGAWQQDATPIESRGSLLAFSAVFSCVTRIASDIAKLRPRLVIEDPETRVCTETRSDPLSRVLEKPNKYQNRIKFFEQWIVSKLLWGNAYVLKVRDRRRVVIELYVLNPEYVSVLIAQNGDVYYRIGRDYLSGIQEDGIVVPASEIIHDMMVSLWHPLVGVTPIYACAQSASLGLNITKDSSRFFKNGSRPGGQLTAPDSIDDETAARLKRTFEEGFSGDNIGRLFVSGNGLKYEAMPTIPATDAQLIEQLKWTVEDVARCFHVPLFKLGIPLHSGNGNSPSLEALNQIYYSDCLQQLLESLEVCLDEGLNLPNEYYTDFDLDGLLRMDQASLNDMLGKSVKGSVRSPNEARAKLNLPPVDGGESPLAQQQDFSLAALAKRDAKPDPFVTTPSQSQPPALPAPSSASLEDDDEDLVGQFADVISAELAV